jgi:hypothetical protein
MFYNFFQAATDIRNGRRDVINDVIELRYFQINSRVGRKLHTKFGVDPTVSEFSKIFSSKIRGSIWLPLRHRQ